MILALDADPESDLQLFGDSGSGFISSEKQVLTIIDCGLGSGSAVGFSAFW